jgi:hypothetical protein
MRCPICQTELSDGATECPECGCGILPPPPTGTEPKAFVRKDAAPWWPLVLSILGVVAALVVIAIALLPLFGDDDKVATSDATSTATDAPVTSVPPTTVAPTTVPATTAPAVVTASSAPPTTVATTTTVETTTTVVTTTGVATTTSAATATSTTAAVTTTVPATATTNGGAIPVPVVVASAAATCVAEPSVDSRGNPITFDPVNVIDENPDTAWRCPGAARNVGILLTLAEPTDLTFVGAVPGYLSTDPYLGTDRWTQNRRVLVARWACLSGSGATVAEVQQLFDDRRSIQYLEVDGFTGCAQVVFEILETSPPGNRDYTAVSQLSLLG